MASASVHAWSRVASSALRPRKSGGGVGQVGDFDDSRCDLHRQRHRRRGRGRVGRQQRHRADGGRNDARLQAQDAQQGFIAVILQRKTADAAEGPATQHLDDARIRLIVEQHRDETAVALLVVQLRLQQRAFPVHALALRRRHLALDAGAVLGRADADHEIRLLRVHLLATPVRPVDDGLGVVSVDFDDGTVRAQRLREIQDPRRVGEVSSFKSSCNFSGRCFRVRVKHGTFDVPLSRCVDQESAKLSSSEDSNHDAGFSPPCVSSPNFFA